MGCLLGMEWVPIGPSWQAQLAFLDMVWIGGLNWACVSDCLPGMEWVWVCGLFTGYGVGPKWGQLASPVGPIWIWCGYLG